MSKGLSVTPIASILPPSIAADPTMVAASTTLDTLLRETTDRIAELATMSRIAELDSPILDHLAWQFHVDTWPDTMTVAGKRATVANGLRIHRRKGSVWSVREALRSLGYTEVVLYEGAQLLADWTAAGGELLDGAGVLDGESTLSAPGANFAWVPTHWAEYAIGMDITDSEFNRAEQRVIMDAAARVAPVRCKMIGLRFYLAMASKRPVAHRYGLKISARYADCSAAHVPSFHLIGNGCEALGGEDVPDFLDGFTPLDGLGTLSGTKPSGEPLNHGWGRFSAATLRMPAVVAALGGGDLVEPLEYLEGGTVETLDGRGWLSLETLDGLGLLDGADDLEVERLEPFRPDVLDGTSRLGELPGARAIWTRCTITHRRYRHIIKEAA